MNSTPPSRSNANVPDIPSKSLENPLPKKPAYATDVGCAVLLDEILRRVPSRLAEDRASSFPLVAAFTRYSSDAARQLLFVAAATHRSADERRTAEYFLRNRALVIGGRRPALSLLLAARCAAEMDARRLQSRERPVPAEVLSQRLRDSLATRRDDPSVGELVIERLKSATGETGSPVTVDRLLDAVCIALDLAKRHAMNGGRGPSLLGMRTDVRRDARLVTYLRSNFGNDTAARSLARLLVGADGTPIENALLWWSAQPPTGQLTVSSAISVRWRRYLRSADAAFGSAQLASLSVCAQALSTAA
jgi:hypothetical protein